MPKRTELPRDFLQKGLFLKEDEEFLKGITSGTVKCKRLTQENALAWLGHPGQSPPEVPEKFCDDFLDLFEKIRDDIICLHSYVINGSESNTSESAKIRRDIIARGTKIIIDNKDHRFLVSMFCYKSHWYWVVIDPLHTKVYWGDTLYDDVAIPPPLVTFVWYYSQARQAALKLKDTPKFTYERIPSPKQKDGVSCGPMACGCLIALFLRNPFDSYPITEFDGSLSAMLRGRIVLSIAKGTLLTEIDRIVETIPDKYESNIPTFFVPILNIQQPTEVFQSLQTQKVIDSIIPVIPNNKLDFALDGIVSDPIFSIPLPPRAYSEVTILVDFKLDPYYIFKQLDERIVITVAALTTIVKTEEKKTIIRATTDRIFEFMNYNQYNPQVFRQEFNHGLQSLRYYPDYTKVPKDQRSIKKQRTNGEKFWVLTKHGFETFIKNNPACRWYDVKRQQGRKTISTKKKDLLMLEDNATPSPSKIISNIPWIQLVENVIRQEHRPLSLDEVVKRMPPFQIDGCYRSYSELPKETRKSVRVAVRQGITTGATDRARRPRRFYTFTEKPKIGKKLSILYVGLIENEGFRYQRVESATSLFEWKQFAGEGPDFRLFCSVQNQHKILYQSDSNDWLNSTPKKLHTKTIIHQGTFFEIPYPENQWIMYNAETAIEYFNMMVVTVNKVNYGYSVASIPEKGTIVLQG